MENFLQALDDGLMKRRKAGSGLQFLPSWHILQVDIDFHVLSASLHNVCNFKEWKPKEDKHQTREFKKNMNINYT